jgi:dihydroorotase
VVAGLNDGTLDCIATDHAPHAIVDKEVEFDQAAFGILGLETAFALAYRLVKKGQLELARLIQSLTYKPLEILGKPYQGLQTGAPADLCLVDLAEEWVYRSAEGYSKSRNSPFDSWQFTARVHSTWVEGRKVYELKS